MARYNWSRAIKNLQPLSTLFNLIVIPLIVLFVGNNYTKSIKEKEIEGKYVELSIDILAQEPSTNNQDTRQWAIDVINKYSGVPLGKAAQKELKNSSFYGSGCTGSDSCNDCKNCKYCKYCSKDGGTCGVCK